MSKSFLIGQLGSFGDCLYATTVAKQIKADVPDSHITWAVASKYKSILLLNPFIDEVWEIEDNDYYTGWNLFETELKRKQLAGTYDEVILTQIGPNWENYDGTIRSSILKAYRKPITVSVNPVVRLSPDEIENVKIFSRENRLSNYKEIILFEYLHGSGQSFVNLEFALSVAERITHIFKDVCFILSSPSPLNHSNSRIVDASKLTYRENAELTKYCTLLIGCSSGLTWLTTSDWAKKINMLQLLDKNYGIYAGIKYDFELWDIPTSNVIEVTVNNVDYVVNCLSMILEKGFDSVKAEYDEVLRPSYRNFRTVIHYILWGKSQGRLMRTFSTVIGHAKRNPYFNIFRLFYIAFLEFAIVYKVKLFTFINGLFSRAK
ncbi:MAG: hypothetical protein NVSMB24_25930 [Mucilaginibacter sp.]